MLLVIHRCDAEYASGAMWLDNTFQLDTQKVKVTVPGTCTDTCLNTGTDICADNETCTDTGSDPDTDSEADTDKEDANDADC